MTNSLTVSNIASTTARLNLTAVNDFGVTVRVFLLLREGNYTSNPAALESSAYVLKTIIMPAGTDIISTDPDATFDVTGLKANTTYSFQWSMTRQTTLSSSTVDRRRPLSPPGTFTTLAAAPVFTSIDVPGTGTVGSFYFGNVTASNTDSYAVISGSLPTGVSLNTSNGNISGTPSAAGTFTFNIRATGPGGTANTGNLSVVISADVTAPAWVDNTLAGDLRVGIAYSDGVEASGTSPTYSVSVGSLPPGLTLNTSTGTVTGTPTAQGSYSFTLRASNTAGEVTQAFTLVVKPGARRWDGSQFVRVTILRRWSGSAWVDVTQLKRWDGSNWVDANA
jgi:hypothetical protein